MSSRQKSNAKYLWWTLLGLGFQPEVASASIGTSKAIVRHITLGIKMFDMPNKDAFYIVTHFLFEKLNHTRAQDMFRHCWPFRDRKADAEFRKVTYHWIRDIAAECGNSFPKVMASLFLSPGGPKFINVMLHFAKHVMLQEMKTFSTDKTWIPEASAAKAQSVEMAMFRYQLVKMRFVSAAVEQDCAVQEYQRRAQALIKSMRDLRAEDAKYDRLLKHEEDMCLQPEKILKVRSLWVDVDRMLSTLEEERKVVDCVLKGNVDQYTLDGTDLTIKVPRILLEQIERSAYSSSVGNLYEAGQLNPLRLLGLLNEALRLLQEKRAQAGGGPLQLDLQHMKEQALLLRRSLDTIKLMRKKISMEDIPEVKAFIRKMDVAWDRKWEDYLKLKSLSSFLNEDPALDILSPMAPLSFEPDTETSFKPNIFSQYPAKLLDDTGNAGRKVTDLQELQSYSCPVLQTSEKSASTSTDRRITDVQDLQSYSRPVLQPSEKSAPTSTVRRITDVQDLQSYGRPPSQPTERPAPSSAVSSRPSTPCEPPSAGPLEARDVKSVAVGDGPPKTRGDEKKAMILDRECDNLANLFADVITTSPADYNRRGMELEELLSNLADPFSTRKQLPRTPESLISEVKSSWRRAVEEGEAEKARLSGRLRNLVDQAFTPELEARKPRPCADASALSSGPAWPQEGDSGSVCTPSSRQQGDSLHSTLPWDLAQLEATQGQSSSDIIHFGIAFETMPEVLGNESILSSSDGALDTTGALEEGEEKELVFPLILSDTEEPEMELRSMRCRFDRIRKVHSEASFTEYRDREKTPEPPSPQNAGITPEAMDWEMGSKVFSLDLDTLESPSPSNSHRLSLPKLVTFSPVDDLMH